MADTTTAPPPADAAAAPAGPRNISRDGDKVADMEYYDLLDVSAAATDIELKKAYRKAAIKNHPDKGGDEEQFKMIGEAYRVLSDSNLRADYDRHGKKKPTDEVGLREATEMFGQLFGGERFVDLIGEISLLKDFGKASEILMSDEEREEIEKGMKAQQQAQAGTTPAPSGVEGTPAAAAAEGEKPAAAGEAPAAADGTPAAAATAAATEEKKSAKAKVTPEQRAKLDELEAEKEKQEKERIEELTRKLKDRIRPFVTARNPGDAADSETQIFERKMREEAEDLKLESFGVELLHAIGNIYLTKSTTWIKTQKHNFLGLPGFFSRLKEKGAVGKEMWNLLGSAVSVQMSMEEMAKRQEKGDIDEEEMKQLEADMSGKMLLATWRGTRWEVTNVLRRVCDNLLNDKTVDKVERLNRARALALLGTIYSQVQPEAGTEHRELENLVAAAAGKNKKKKHPKGSKVNVAGSSPAATPAPAPAA